MAVDGGGWRDKRLQLPSLQVCLVSLSHFWGSPHTSQDSLLAAGWHLLSPRFAAPVRHGPEPRAGTTVPYRSSKHVAGVPNAVEGA
jgi:hypothetical protein